MEIKINGKDISLARLTLKGWAGLEEIKKNIDNTASIKDYNKNFENMVKFIEAIITSDHKIDWLQIPWFDFLEVFAMAVQINLPTVQFPIFRGNAEKQKPLPWEYDGRAWYFWLNLFATNYGWNEEQIALIDIDTAFGLYQELEIAEQMGREWQWGLSEIAYPYDKSTKKQKYKPLERPDWMKPIIPKQLPIVRMRKDLLPIGNIIDLQQQELDRNKKKSGI